MNFKLSTVNPPILFYFKILAIFIPWFSVTMKYLFSSFFFKIFISWRLITLQYCSGFCHTLTWISHGFTCIPHPDPPSHLPLYLIPLGLPSAPGPSLYEEELKWSEVAQSCPTLCDPMDCSLPGSSLEQSSKIEAEKCPRFRNGGEVGIWGKWKKLKWVRHLGWLELGKKISLGFGYIS